MTPAERKAKVDAAEKPTLHLARQLAASEYAEGTPVRNGILSGHNDLGDKVITRIDEAAVALLKERPEAGE